MVLMTRNYGALWVTSWPFAQYTKHRWAGAWVNSLFRRESGTTASELIRQALAITRWRWPAIPTLGMVTFVNRKFVTPTKVRGRDVYGWSYLKAGFKDVGETKGGLLALQLLPEDFPAPMSPYLRSTHLLGFA